MVLWVVFATFNVQSAQSPIVGMADFRKEMQVSKHVEGVIVWRAKKEEFTWKLLHYLNFSTKKMLH